MPSFNPYASVANVAPLVLTIPSGQWSGSSGDYYISVTASRVTENSILVPNYDSDSAGYLKGPVWCVPGDGSFTVHTSAMPTGSVTIMVQFPGTMGEAEYQVLADVYSTSQAVAKADIVNDLTTDDATGEKPAGQHEVYQLNNLTKNMMLFISKYNVAITNGSSSSPANINVDLSTDIGDNYSFWGADVYVQSGGTIYKLPYLHNSNGSYLLVEGYSGKTIKFKNTSTGWGTCTLYIVAFVART